MRVEHSPPGGPSRANRELRAAGPGPEVEALRRAYLDLLKLCLCDLAGPSTTSVRGLAHGRVASRELVGDQRSLRVDGRDWPAHGLTMAGLRRLDDLERCVERIVTDRVDGDLIEVGCWRGGASILVRATLDSLGASDRTLWVADSFQGFPPPDARAEGADDGPDTMAPYLAAFDFLAAPLEEVRASFERFGCERGTRFVPGLFDDTLPGLSPGRWSLIRLDADTYDSTLLALRCLYPGLSKGGYLIVDDYDALAECREAVEYFREQHGINEPLERIDWTCVRWQRQSDATIEPAPAPRPASSARVASSRPQQGRVPTEQELELAQQLAELRDRLERTQSELVRAREFEHRLQEVTSSTSWRVTRPLRELSLRLRSLRPGH